MPQDRSLVLVFVPGSWRVVFENGSAATIRADGFHESAEEFVFTVLVKGQPNEEFIVARLPASVVRYVEGGPIA